MGSIQENIHTSVCLLEAIFNESNSIHGTGFFYRHLSKEGIIEGRNWVEILNEYFVTAKHCLYRYDEEDYSYKLCDQLILKTAYNNEGEIKVKEIEISKDLLQDNIILHINEDVDIALVDFGKLKKILMNEEDQIELMQIASISRHHLPEYNEMIEIETTSEVIVYGFPHGYYDHKNLFPLCKSGVISSGWGLLFNDEQEFKIDVQLFPISSGSPVILKPTNQVVKNKKLYISETKKIIFLGMYVGEYQKKIQESIKLVKQNKEIEIQRDVSLGFGTVIYSNLIEELIADTKLQLERNTGLT